MESIMKKIKITMTVIFAVLFSCLFLMGCPPDDMGFATGSQVYARGKLLILQAYGSSDTAEGVSHSFVELYNISDRAINLNGIGLYYADGTTVPSGEVNTATEDGAWTRISLNGKTIPAYGSFLILGPKESSAARYQIPEDSGDINDENFTLSNRAFKVALIQGTAHLTVQNPFNADSGKPVAGYIDMAGAANDYQSGRDLIFGFETAPARNSGSEAVRRKNLIDTDNNRGVSADFPEAEGDFDSIRYASDGISDEELEVRKPRNSVAGAWDPFVIPADEYDGLPPTQVGTASDHAGTLLILQIGASADDDNNISHSFVELYNAGDTSINLSGFTLQYAAGTKVAGGAENDGKWEKIDLTGTIEEGHSFLILGAKRSTSQNPALNITDGSGDINIATFKLDNRAVKVALMQSANLLTVQNPFNMDEQGGKAAGYVDMIGVINDDTDQILGWEGSAADGPTGTAPFRITKQVGVRRTSLNDTDVNKNDFAIVTYLGMPAEVKEVMRPKNHNRGNWDPFADPEDPVIIPTDNTLLILQANTYGNNSNGGFSKSLVELYNNSDTEVDLDGYYLHIGTTNSWTAQIDLSEKSIPAGKSFLIVSSTDTYVADTSADLPTEDMSAAFTIVNDNFKIALMRNGRSTLSVANPFGDADLADDYVDMLGVGTAIDGYETERATGQSRPRPVRRTSLIDSDNNAVDFTALDYRTNQANRITTPDFYKYWPRSAQMDAWDPITGLPQVQPQNINSRHNP
jgi:hypothetical protein